MNQFKPLPLGSSTEEKNEQAVLILRTIIANIESLALVYDSLHHEHASYEVRKIHQKLITMGRILHPPLPESKLFNRRKSDEDH